MTVKFGFSLGCAAGLMALSMGALAQVQTSGDAGAKPKPVTTFGYLDTNKDLRISREEAKADWAVKQRFAEADLDHDGYLSEQEFKRLQSNG